MTQIDLQNSTIAGISKVLKTYNSVGSFALTGSHAKNEQTEYSDIDLIVVFKTDEREHLDEIFKKVAELKPTLSTLYQLYDENSLFLYEDGVRLDLTLLKPSSFAKWTLTYGKILYDPEGIFQAQINKSNKKPETAAHPKWNEKEGSFIDWFFWMFRQAYCYACQSERITPKSFDKTYLAQDAIQKLREKLIDTLYYVNGSRDYMLNIDTSLTEQLASSYVSANVDDTLSAIRILSIVYGIIIGKYCKKEHLSFPSHKIEIMKSLFDQFDKLRVKP